MTCPAPHFINVRVAVFAWGVCQIVRHPSRFSHAASLTFQYSRRAINMSPLRGYPNFMVADDTGSWAKTASSVRFLGNMHKLKVFSFTFYISRIGGYSLHIQNPLAPLNSQPFNYAPSLHTQCNQPLEQHVWGKSGYKGTILALETMDFSESPNGAVRAKKTKTKDGSPFSRDGNGSFTSFSQNPKLVLVASDFRCNSSGISHHQN